MTRRLSGTPEGTRFTKRTVTLPREFVDEILKRAAWSGWLHLYDMPYNSAVSKLINVKFENVVYTVSLALDGSTACVDGYWGSCQRVVAGDNMATADQLKSLVDRWLTTT